MIVGTRNTIIVICMYVIYMQLHATHEIYVHRELRTKDGTLLMHQPQYAILTLAHPYSSLSSKMN